MSPPEHSGSLLPYHYTRSGHRRRAPQIASGPGIGGRVPLLRLYRASGPSLGTTVAVSLALHLGLIGVLFLKIRPETLGEKQGREAPEMEMIFQQPTHNSMTGQQAPNSGAGSLPPPPPNPPSETAKQKTPAGFEIPPSETGELQAAQKQNQRPNHRKRAPKTRPATHHPEQNTPSPSDNPFARLPQTRVTFPGAPSERPAQKPGRRSGNGGAIDMSPGPLSVNGAINAPYVAKSSIKGVSPDYSEEIDKWIRKHLYYPPDAAARGEEGPSSVHVTLNRSGQVSKVTLQGQSGSYELDNATVSMFSGRTLPPVPPDMKGDHFDFDVTVNYILIRH